MDVTYGLLSNLVKTKSIQRILAPIASQISLLIILNESDDVTTVQYGDMVPCAQAVVQASNKLAMVAKQQAGSSTDSEFIAQTLSSCEVLELSSANLYVASERLEATGMRKEAKNKLIQASKDVLQGTMKVLLVADDAEIRRLLTASHIVTEKLGAVSEVSDMTALVKRFKDFTDALSVLTGLADKRQRDLVHSRQRERIIASLNILKKSVSSLSTSMQSYVKYASNPQAQAGKSFVINEILSSIRDINEAVQNRDTVEDDELVVEEPGNFVTNIDQALESVAEDNRDDLHHDLEMWVEEIVRHSMTVAHMCRDGHRDVIVKTCQRVIQVKNRVLEMKTNLTESSIPQMREDYDEVCEMLTDEFCELEKNVNISLLHLVVEHFKETTEPLERLVKRAVYTDVMITLDDFCVSDFEDHAEKICQIASLAAASSTDSNRVFVIRSSTHRLEHLDPEIVPAAVNISRNKHNKAVTRHLKLLMKEWSFELTSLIEVLDEMTDPKMFMLVSERCVEDDINSCNGCILIADQKCFTQMIQSMIGRSRRVAMVAERIVDGSDDALFRNGLMIFVQQLKKAITAVRTAGAQLAEQIHSKTLQDTVRRRFTFLQDSLIKVKLGLSESNHPHVLSPLRRNVRGAKLKENSEVPLPKKSLPKLKLPTGDSIIATSVPKLSLPVSTIEGAITPNLVVGQKTQPSLIKSQSVVVMSQSEQVIPRTYAWKLSRDLVTWATKGDKQRVNILCGDLLGWTNHIAEAFTSVKQHCTDLNRKRQNELSCGEVDELTPKILEKAKYVLHGDFSDLNSLKTHCEDWATKIEKIRVFVDITVDKWNTLTDKICEICKSRNIDLLNHQLKLLQNHQEAILDLVMITEKFRWENQVKGQHVIDTLMEDRNELENLTVTLKTTSEMIIDNDSKRDLVELEQLGRDWSVQMYSMTTHLVQLVEELLTVGRERKLWMNIATCDNLTEYLQDEIKKLKDLLKSACYGEEDKKDLQREYLADMRDCIEDIKSVGMRKSTVSIVTTQYTSIKLGLYRGYWILKAVQCIDLARQQTAGYCTSIDVLIDEAFQLKAATVSERQGEESHFKMTLDNFTENSSRVRKKVLQSIQLSAELEKRSVVRQCLDSITTLTPQVCTVINTFAGSIASSCIGDVIYHRLLWSAKLKHLVTVLQQMSDLKTTLIPEILKLLKPEGQSPDCDTISTKLQNSGILVTQSTTLEPGKAQVQSSTNEPNKLDLNENIQTKNSPKSHQRLYMEQSNDDAAASQFQTQRPGNSAWNQPASGKQAGKQAGKQLSPERLFSSNNQFYGADSSSKFENFEPVVVIMKDIEEQIILNARQILRELMDLLNQDRSPLGNTNPQVILEPNIQRNLSHFSLITHGFGSPAIVASLTSVQNYLNEMLKVVDPSLKKNDKNIKRHSDEVEDLHIKEEELAKQLSPVKSTSDAVKPYSTMLKDAEYLEKEAQRWEDANNPIVKVAQTMAMQISHMTQYIRRAGPITSHLGLVTTSKAVSDNARKILKFAQILVQSCVDERFCMDLKSHCSLVPTVIQQLTILTNLHLATAKTDIADRMLVVNSQNLLKKILEMMSACEAVCIKGLKAEVGQDAENAALLAMEWRQKYASYYRQEASEAETDELGLRRVEYEYPPPSLAQIFNT